jgi:catechol 2,3-dioxygenase-like lactoylglutathione lyase family enzyme
MATHWTVTFDAADPRRLAAFWALALGYTDEPGYDFPGGASLVDPAGALPAISFLAVPEGKTAKNRVHLDVRVPSAPGIRAKVAELVAAGATAVREEHDDDRLSHIEMRDPEGNEFCVARGPDSAFTPA